MKANKLFLLAMGLVAVGCNESQIEEQSLINDAQGEAVEVVIDATVAPVSRAISDVDYSNDAETKSAVDLTFEVGDEIGVYFNNETVGLTHENVKFTASEKTETGVKYTTTEPMILLGAGNNVYAYYPYEATETGFEGSVSRSANLGAWDGYHWFEVPAEQVQVDTKDYSGLSQYVKLISKEKQLTKEGNKVKVNMAFQHAFSYFSLNVKNLTGKEISIKEAVIKVFNGEDAVALAGEFGAVLDDEVDGAKVVAGENVQTAVTVIPADSMVLAADDKTLITAALAPIAAYDRIELTLRTVDGFVYKVVKTISGTKTLEQGTNQQLSFEVSDETLSSEVTNSEVAEYMLHMDKEHIVLDVAANIELAINATSDDAWGGPSTKTITINGGADGLTKNRIISFNIPLNEQGKQETGWNDVDLVNTDATLYIKNIKLQVNNKKYGYSSNNLMFNCKVDLEKVIANNSITAFRSFTANTLIVGDVKAGNSTNNYALWLQPTVEEQIVNINGFQTLNMTEKGIRGIKIDADTHYDSFDDSGLGPQKVVLTLDGNNFFNTTKKAAILVRTKVGAEINIEGNMDIANVVDDQVNHIWIDEGAYTKEDVEKITIKNARWKLEGATWSVENDANGAVVTAYAEDNDGLAEAIGYGMNTIALTDGGYTLPDVPEVGAARMLNISGSKDAVFTLNGTPNLNSNSLMLSGVTVNTTNKGDGVKATTVYYSNVAVNGSLTFYGQYAYLMSSTMNVPNGLYLYVGSVNNATISGTTFNTAGRAILINNPSDTDGKIANKVTVKGCTFKGTKPAYTNGALVGQPCAAIEIDNLWKNFNPGAAHQLTTEKNNVSESFSAEWRIENYVETAEGESLTVDGKPYAGYYMGQPDGKVYQLTAENNGNVEATPVE